jgi:hypothetical protein
LSAAAATLAASASAADLSKEALTLASACNNKHQNKRKANPDLSKLTDSS